ncbi:MAG TPA: META domain-containing protein [Thermoanaerobaculia bacterium]|nr:META domain-containing protein [Thermoanaerobaculia bacterium]
MRMMILIVAAALMIPGCTMSTAQHEELREREWKLVSIEGFATMPSGVANPTIFFANDGRLRGNTGCNTAGAAYTTEGDRLTIDAMFTTKRACVDPNGGELERRYIEAVEATRRFAIEGGELQLIDGDGKVVARFR